MIKKILFIAMAPFFAFTSLITGFSATAHESAANQYMHEAEFDTLAARFEDPARAQWQKPEKVVASLEPLAGKTVADIGAGTGYFTFPIAAQAAKVIAIDIDQRFLHYIEHKKETQKTGANIETRLTTPDSAGLKAHEADLVLIVDTWHHIENRIAYLKKLKEGIRPGGLLVIIDFKKEKTPLGPPVELRLAEEQVQSELKSAGFNIVSVDRELLSYQYIVKAR